MMNAWALYEVGGFKVFGDGIPRMLPYTPRLMEAWIFSLKNGRNSRDIDPPCEDDDMMEELLHWLDDLKIPDTSCMERAEDFEAITWCRPNADGFAHVVWALATWGRFLHRTITPCPLNLFQDILILTNIFKRMKANTVYFRT